MIITFYSYKGGVGRSMALANVGTWLYQRGHRVLLVDWDLEAPGLESFFSHTKESLKEILARPGLIDLIESYRQLWDSTLNNEQDASNTNTKASEILQKLGNIQHLLVPLGDTKNDIISTRKPGLWLLHAGCRAGDSENYYTKTVNAMDWGRFYDEFSGFAFFEWLRHQFEKDVEFVLIDSRTGITEMGGVCTQHLADIAILLFAPNYSNLHGVHKITEILLSEKLKNLRGPGRPLKIFPIPARVDTQGATNQLEVFEKHFKKEFEKFSQIDVSWCWESKIPYITNYSYEEKVLFMGESGHTDLRKKYERIGSQIALLHEESLGISERGVSASYWEMQKNRQQTDIEGVRRTVRELISTAQGEIDRGEFLLAEKLLGSGHALSERDLGEEHPETLRAKNMLGTVLNSQAKFNSAREIWEQLIIIYRREHGNKDPLTLSAMNNLAITLRNQGDFERALEIFQEIYQLHRTIFGEEHSDTLTSMTNLSETLRALGKLGEAKALQERALVLSSRLLGEEHPDTLASMESLSETLTGLGILEEAKSLQERVLDSRIRILGEGHPDSIRSRKNLASIHLSLGNRATAHSLEKTDREPRSLTGRTIYLSSTYEDLKDYRRVVFEALRRAGYQVIGMEEYVATDRRPVDQCLHDVEEADIYVGLLAFRYGYVPPLNHSNSNNLSITELEFRHAEALRKPCLTFVMDDNAPHPVSFTDSFTSEDKGERINALRQYFLTEKMSSTFSNPHELASLVLAAVAALLGTKESSENLMASKPARRQWIIWDIEKDGSPYPGLMHFTRKYAPVFFGRDAEVREILDRLREPEGRFLLISGDSGVGKSSVVDAGLLPILETGGLPDAESCLSVRMLPSQRQQPLEALLGAFGDLVTKAGFRPDMVNEAIQAPDTLGTWITALMKESASSRILVLFIDQMEELFTAHDLTQANRFLSAIYQAANEHDLWVIGTIRSDHLHYCYRHPDMLKVLRGRGHYPLGRVEPYMMQDMILKPANVAGLTIIEPFAKRLIHDTGAESGNLPLLAFVLYQLFQQRKDHELSEAVYDRLGGVSGAIDAHVKTVEATIERRLGVKAGEVLPGLFHVLAKVQKEEDIPTRNRQKKHVFPAHLQPVINQLVAERLFRTEGEGEEATVSISHEIFFETWPRLKEYVETHKKALVDRTLLESRAKKWADTGKPSLSGLATGREYYDFQQAGANAGGLMKEFLQASRRARRIWMAGGLVGVLLLMGLTWLWQKGYNMEQAMLKVQSLVVSIHVPPDMVLIPGGTYRQGDVEGLGTAWEKPVREITIQPFALAKHEVTFEEYDRFAIATNRVLPNDQAWGRGRRPVINVSWEDAKGYAAWLSEETGQRYRLPTESEWEYAARTGDKQEVWAGTSDEKQLGDYAVYLNNSGNRTGVVGMKKRNALGLYDMSGNVFELVDDCFHITYQDSPLDGSTWLEADNGDCSRRVVRGGSWNNKPSDVRASYRDRYNTGDRTNLVGFRLAQDTP